MNIKEQIKLLEKIKSEIKQSQTIIDLFKEKNVDLNLLDFIPMCFGDVPVSARTQHGIIYFNKKLLNSPEQINHYMIHEVTHVLQQCFGDKPTQGANVGNYLENPYEIEGFQKQVEFISEEKDINQAEKYVNKVLKHHKVPKQEIKEKKEELMLEASKQTSFDFIHNDVENFSKELLKSLDEEKEVRSRKDKMKLQKYEKEYRLLKLKEILEILDDKIKNHKLAFLNFKTANIIDPNKYLNVDDFITWAINYYTTQVRKHIIETINEIKDIDLSEEPELLKQDLVERYLLLNNIKNIPDENNSKVSFSLDEDTILTLKFNLVDNSTRALFESKNNNFTIDLFYSETIDSLEEYNRNIQSIIDSINHESVHVLQYLYGYGQPNKYLKDEEYFEPSIDLEKYYLIDEEFYPNLINDISRFNNIYKNINKEIKYKLALIWVNGFSPSKQDPILKSVYKNYLAISNFFIALYNKDKEKWRKASKIFLKEVL